MYKLDNIITALSTVGRCVRNVIYLINRTTPTLSNSDQCRMASEYKIVGGLSSAYSMFKTYV